MYHQSITADQIVTAQPVEPSAAPASPMLGLMIALPLGAALWAGLFELVYLLA
ncbi:hypothetical protein P1X14_18885 [Sphingomonas sp. AOB5]|uniref:hypothetical protein n=1 Tax=Sphingomonas sp. AOB5 TaxID=3034017 RepID=UPI0023FA0C68|nr:hypothetical protein [Sphingomonas sp. AOB5]MDF7777331.1 hypothetical protein [Sphingomonas sp. AOB5]